MRPLDLTIAIPARNDERNLEQFFSAIGRRVWLYNFAPIRIGTNTVVSQDSVLCTSSHDYTHPHLPLYSREIIVGDEAWIAANCFVMPGITVGSGAVVGACSVVTKSIPPWMVCAGNPCRPLKPLRLRRHKPQAGFRKLRQHQSQSNNR